MHKLFLCMIFITYIAQGMRTEPEQSINPEGKERPLPPVIVIMIKGEEERIREVMDRYISMSVYDWDSGRFLQIDDKKKTSKG